MTSSPIIIALDFAQAQQALDFARQLQGRECRVKVGKELFTRGGYQVVEQLVDMGFEVFLDLKFHDIPNTVAAACRAAADLGVWMVNVHAQGGSTMMKAARQAIDESEHKPLLIAVTVLTSLSASDLQEVGIAVSPEEQVLRLANLAQDCGLDGVVCSPLEIQTLRQQLAPEFQLVTPGIRPASHVADDQKRILTPAQAIQAGSNYLVIGRPITQAPNPLQALNAIEASLS